MSPARIHIADPLDPIAEGIRSWLIDAPDLTLAGHARTGHDLLRLLLVAPADLVLLEVTLPGMDGIDTMREIHGRYPHQSVLAYSVLPDIEYVNSMLIEVASGYLLKSAGREEFLLAVRTVLKGGRYLSENAQASLEKGYSYTDKRPEGEYVGLTQRERDIIRMVAQERTNAEIGAALFISEDTVKSHRKKVMTKLNVRSTAGLVKYALDRRWA
ncbi:MAG: response regulator transcription factor [Flavobacteriales bacterium]